MLTSAIFYDGPSLLTGDPIVAVVTGLGSHRSDNPKTGPMLQTWILRRDMAPNEAVKTGGDSAICGDCPLRSGHRYDRACYVTWWFAPMRVYSRLRTLPFIAPEDLAPILAGEHVRIGSYGDPAAVPFEVWDRALAEIEGWTAYTHQWRTCDQRFRDLLMASVESEAGADEAHAMGWRTFRVRKTQIDPVLSTEVICPASDEAGHRATCETCELCRGASRPAKSVVIVAHGRWAGAVRA